MSNQVIDVPATTSPADDKPPTQALAIRESQSVGLFGTNDPGAVIEKATSVANALKAVIVKQGLVSNIQGKLYPKCEAWTLLGTMLGVFPVTVWTRQVEGGWEARVEARTRDGATIGAAEAQCLKSERNWGNRDDFALRSMAQTRATAKCLRMPLGFVMTLSGFEPTPSEEMPHEPAKPPRAAPPAPRPPPAPPSKVQEAIFADQETRKRFVAVIIDQGLGDVAMEFYAKVRDPSGILDNEGLENMPLSLVPINRGQLRLALAAIRDFGNGSEAKHPFAPNPVAQEPVEAPPQRELVTPEAVEEWRAFPMPWGKKAGVALGRLEKNYLFGLWANYQVETEFKGKPKKAETVAKDETFRAMLDLAGAHYGFQKKDEAPEGLSDHEGGAGEPQDGPDDSQF